MAGGRGGRGLLIASDVKPLSVRVPSLEELERKSQALSFKLLIKDSEIIIEILRAPTSLGTSRCIDEVGSGIISIFLLNNTPLAARRSHSNLRLRR